MDDACMRGFYIWSEDVDRVGFLSEIFERRKRYDDFLFWFFFVCIDAVDYDIDYITQSDRWMVFWESYLSFVEVCDGIWSSSEALEGTCDSLSTDDERYILSDTECRLLFASHFCFDDQCRGIT